MVKEANKKNSRAQLTTSIYLRDIAHYGFLSQDEERAFAQASNNGSLDGRNELVHAHARLVVKIARQYKTENNVALDDLIQEGNVGLIHAADKFRTEKDNRFSTYAVWWIRHYIQRYLDRNHSLIRLPFRKVKELRVSSKKEELAPADVRSYVAQLDDEGDVKKPEFTPQVIQSKNETFSPELFSSRDSSESLLLVKEKLDIEKKLMKILTDEEYNVIYERFFAENKKVSVRLVAERLELKETYVRKVIRNACVKMKLKAIEWGFVE